MGLMEKVQRAEIAVEEAKLELMEKIFTYKGFLLAYNECVNKYGNSERAFNEVTGAHFYLFGFNKYANYMDFIKQNTVDKKLHVLARTYLIEWFKSKGFDTWQSFSPVVLHYFPDVTKQDLRAFYDGKKFTENALQKVEYVKQILG